MMGELWHEEIHFLKHFLLRKAALELCITEGFDWENSILSLKQTI